MAEKTDKTTEETKESFIEQFWENYKAEKKKEKDENAWTDEINQNFTEQFNYIIKKATMYNGFKNVLEPLKKVIEIKKQLQENSKGNDEDKYTKENELLKQLKEALKKFYENLPNIKEEIVEDKEEDANIDVNTITMEKINKIKEFMGNNDDKKIREKIKIGSKLDDDSIIIEKVDDNYMIVDKTITNFEKKKFSEIKNIKDETADSENMKNIYKQYVVSVPYLMNLEGARVDTDEQNKKLHEAIKTDGEEKE